MKELLRGKKTIKIKSQTSIRDCLGAEKPNTFTIEETQTSDISQISTEENEILTTVFSEKEIHDALMQMEKNKAPGPGGFPAEFYQCFWKILKHDLINMFTSFTKASCLFTI